MASTKVTVVVLGDIGRSPRMQYHAESFLKEGFSVTLIGYGGSKPIEQLTSHPKCQIKYLPQPPMNIKYLPKLITYLLKILWQIFVLSYGLVMSAWPKLLIVQTPPAIPALIVCFLYCQATRVKLVIDWHNYAFSIMALTHGKDNVLVKASEFFEGFLGRRSDVNLCVTKAMKEDLSTRWKIRAMVLYDRPPEHFGSVTEEESRVLFTKYDELAPLANAVSHRPRLLVSSTSWTEDEDFSILFSALEEYESSEELSLPSLVCVVTGKGPLREYYLSLLASKQWSRVTVISMWLEAADYPRLLASADLGVSLHTSSSGLDLPMKVVDMFGCGLPVAALHFSCLDELVRHNENGLVFRDSHELSQQLQNWFSGKPNSRDKFRKAIEQFQSLRWHDNWKLQALPLFSDH